MILSFLCPKILILSCFCSLSPDDPLSFQSLSCVLCDGQRRLRFSGDAAGLLLAAAGLAKVPDQRRQPVMELQTLCTLTECSSLPPLLVLSFSSLFPWNESPETMRQEKRAEAKLKRHSGHSLKLEALAPPPLGDTFAEKLELAAASCKESCLGQGSSIEGVEQRTSCVEHKYES